MYTCMITDIDDYIFYHTQNTHVHVQVHIYQMT